MKYIGNCMDISNEIANMPFGSSVLGYYSKGYTHNPTVFFNHGGKIKYIYADGNGQFESGLVRLDIESSSGVSWQYKELIRHKGLIKLPLNYEEEL